MRCVGGYAFATSFSWQEMLARLRRTRRPWNEWWSLSAGDTIDSVVVREHFERHVERLMISRDHARSRWLLDIQYQSMLRDADDHWEALVDDVVEVLYVVDASAIERISTYASKPVPAWPLDAT